jgi:hypothetical protein
MKAYSINPLTKEVKEIDIEMQVNTVFTFFNSILTDELSAIDKHTIHTDANAVSENKEPFFIGEQLVVGNALIIGKDGLYDTQVTIPHDDLKSLINYDIPTFYKDALNLLQNTNINLYRIFEVTKEEEDIKLNTEWVLYVFNMADAKTKEYFLEELKKAVDAQKDIAVHMQNMAILALRATT